MFRSLLALSSLVAAAAPVCAQRGHLPLAPGVRPASPIGPGTQFLPQPTPRFHAPLSGMSGSFRTHAPHSAAYRAIGYGGSRYLGYGYGVYGYGGYGYGYGGYGYGGYGYGGYGYGNTQQVVVGVFPPFLLPSHPHRVVLANEFPATLTVQFPAAADVWLNGAEVKGEAAEERVLTSPVLKPGESFEFDIRGRWEHGGKTYEAKRTVTLEAGARSRLIIVSGTEVK